MSQIQRANEILERHGVKLVPTSQPNEYVTLCPFHDDTSPSCGVNLEKQVFKCHACDAHGDLISLLSGHLKLSRNATLGIVGLRTSGDDNVIDPLHVEEWHLALMLNAKMLETLCERKGITKATAEKFNLGLRQGRVSIPVYDETGEIVNVRCWSPTNTKSKMINIAGHGRCRVVPHAAMNHEAVVLVEGEFKAFLLQQMGMENAASLTLGAGNWDEELAPEFKGKTVYIMFDVDDAGRHGSRKLAHHLVHVGATPHVIDLPIDPIMFPTGGIDEFVLKMGKTLADIQELIVASQPFTAPLTEEVADASSDPVMMHLGDASRAEHHGKIVQCDVLVSAKDTAPFIVPKKVEVVCARDKEQCAFCPAFNPADATFTVRDTDPRMLEMIGVTASLVSQTLKKIRSIPEKCNSCKLVPLESQNVEELRLIPQLKMTMKPEDHVVRRAFYVGYGIEPNTAYNVIGKVCSEPKTQYATLLVTDAKPAIDSLSTFELHDPDRLKVFQPTEWTDDALQNKLSEIYADLESNVTQIFQRRDMHLFYDLVYHSLLYIPFQGRVEKGWVEGLVLGDSGQGKSETIKRLLIHYQVGEKIDAKGASVAGLLGGLQETNKRWFVAWGIIPLNDRRLVVLEEIKGMDPTIISKLTDMRSSGIAEISKIEKTRTNARTRLVWISNARSDRQILAYNYGVEAIKELIGSLEDIRRFDMAITVASGEVGKEVLNMAMRNRPTCEHRFTSDLCRDLILWAWSRSQEQVQFPSETVDAILAGAGQLADKFISSIPLVEPADQRLKLARLSAALAARTFSTEDYATVIVRPCHVNAVVQFLTEQYSKRSFGYLEYSQLLRGEQTLTDEDGVKAAVMAMPYARDVVKQLLAVQGFTIFDIMTWTEMDRDSAQTILSALSRKNAIKRAQSFYIKTPAFIAMLRRMDTSGELKNESLLDLESKEL